MTRQSSADAGFGVSIVASTVIHLAVFLLLVWWGRFSPPRMAMQETYYVDVVNLPVALPRAGNPTQRGNDAEAPAPPVSQMDMPVPAQAAGKQGQNQAQQPQDNGKAATESDSFAERMARLEDKAALQQQEAALERLRRKAAMGSGRAGMPAAGGSEAGSDYAAYIQSRLKDAFRTTISYTTRTPEVMLRLTIAEDGRISRQKIERSSGDRAFELSVVRAIDIASEKFPPPPGRKAFEGAFVFRPQGISAGKQ